MVTLFPKNDVKRVAITLAEFFSSNSACQRKTAFTLAEVLVTLGIIGIVAAMTMPALFSNYQKNVTVTRLERTYNIFSNVLVKAQVDYGDPSNWNFVGVGVELDGSEENANIVKQSVENAVKKYILPYLADGFRYENRVITPRELGYTSPIKFRSGASAVTLDVKLPILIMNDGTWIFASGHSYGGQTLTDGSVSPKRNYGMRLFIDVNGPKPPNIIGRDGFILTMPFTSNAHVSFYRNTVYRPTKSQVIYVDMTRDEMLDNCENGSGIYCGILIQSDGWKINYKY